MTIDLLTATQDALFARLSASVPSGTAPVYQHVPEGAQPPMIIVGDIAAEPIGAKDDGLERLTGEIEFYHRGEGRVALLAIMHAGRDALDGQTITAAGALLSEPRWLGSDAVKTEDGVTYFGLMKFEVIAQSG